MFSITAGRTINTLSHHWCTPPKYVEAIHRFFNNKVELDPCSNQQSILKANLEYKLPEQDGLKLTWDYKTIYVNPPYGRDGERKTTIKDWLKKCSEANEIHNSEVLALIPVATNTSHWKKYIFGKATAICFLADTRLKFLIDGNTENKGSPMACAMVYWGNDSYKFYETFKEFGSVVDIENLKSL